MYYKIINITGTVQYTSNTEYTMAWYTIHVHYDVWGGVVMGMSAEGYQCIIKLYKITVPSPCIWVWSLVKSQLVICIYIIVQYKICTCIKMYNCLNCDGFVCLQASPYITLQNSTLRRTVYHVELIHIFCMNRMLT